MTKTRTLLTLTIGALTLGIACYNNSLREVGRPTDFQWAHYAARCLLQHRDPYTITPDAAFIPYPLTAALVALPLAPLPELLAISLFTAGSTALLAWGLTRPDSRGQVQYWRLCLFTSFPCGVAVLTNQWSMLLCAIMLFPALLPLVLAKPQFALAVGLPRLSTGRVLAGVGLGLASLLVYPRWPWVWMSQLGPYTGYVPLLTCPWLLVALVRYRDPVVWQFLLLCVTPQQPYAYDALLLWMLPRCKIEMLVMTCLNWALMVWLRQVAHPTAGVSVACFYLPALVVVLSPTGQLLINRLARRATTHAGPGNSPGPSGEEEMNCVICGCTIPVERLEALPGTRTCVNHSQVKARVGFLDYAHKTAPSLVQVDPDQTEQLRLARRAYRRSR